MLAVGADGASGRHPATCTTPLPRVEARDDLASFSVGLIAALKRAPLGGAKCLKRVLPCVPQRGLWLEFGVPARRRRLVRVAERRHAS